MTAEELAARASAIDQVVSIISRNIKATGYDAGIETSSIYAAAQEVLTYTDAQAQRIAELEAQLAASGALATAQAVTLTEEDRAFIAEHHGRIYLMPGEQAKLWVIIDRITGASTPAEGDKP